jgi:hypothetical protein
MLGWAAVLIVLLLLAFWLRWRYVQTISLYVDEFTTLWAARQVQLHGAPIMPSGVLYTRGLLASYIEAAFLTVFGFSYTVGRLPSVLFGLGTISATVWLGWREWRSLNGRGWGIVVGWLAALGLALLPEAIIWSSRARFYAQLQFFALLATWAAYRTLLPPESTQPLSRSPFTIHHSLFIIFFTLALFSQEEMLLLYPAFLLATMLWRGWRHFRQPAVLTMHALCLLVMALRFAIEILGQPGYFETIQSERPYVGLIFDLRGAWRAYAPLLIAPERLLWSVAGLIAVGAALAALGRGDRRLADLPRFHQATLFFGLHFGFVLLVLLAFVGTSWREARYLLLVQPFWLLVGAAGALWLVDAVSTGFQSASRWRWVGVSGLTVLAFVSLYPAAERVLNQPVEGYDRALAQLARVRQPGEAILSPQPPACALVLGACDFYAVGRGYEEFVIPRDGVWVDRWTGSRLLTTTAQLAAVLHTAPRTWFVTDSFRLATRYEADFVRTVVEQFTLEQQTGGVLVLRAEGWQPPPIQPISRTLASPLAIGPLGLVGWARSTASPGAPLTMTLFWQGLRTIEQRYNTSLRLVTPDGAIVAQDDGPPAGGLIPTNLFFAAPLPDLKRIDLPADLSAGRYRLDLAVYDVVSLVPLGEPVALDWVTVGPPPAPPEVPINARWEPGLRLVGREALPRTLRPGESLSLRLVWQTETPLLADYTVFLHLVGADGAPFAQADRAPAGGFYPTGAWAVGEPVADTYTLTLPADVPEGPYQLLVGWYRPETGERVRLEEGGDVVVLQEW